MDLTRMLRQPILVEHVTQDGPPDAMGDPSENRSWSRFLGWVWQTSVNETTGGGTIATEDWQVALERSAAGQIDTGDRIIANGELDGGGSWIEGTGELFDVAGPPWPALNPRTQLVEFVQARLVRTA